MHRRASSWRVVCGLLIAATIVAACARDQITNPFGSGRQPAGPASHAIITSLGSYSIPIPASNVPGDGTVGTGPTGITVPAGTYYRVRVTGNVTLTGNDNFCGGATPPSGSYGPGGIPGSGALVVSLEASNTDGSGTGPIRFLNYQAGDSVGQSDVLYAAKETAILAGRSGVIGSCNKNDGSGSQPAWFMGGSQTLVVEKVENMAHFHADPVAVHPGTTVTFYLSRDDSLPAAVYSWQWQPDAGQHGSPWTNNFIGWTNYQWAPPGSGTMYVNTSLGVLSAHVTVYSNFTLGVAPSTVDKGDSATFTPLFDGAPQAVAAWRWAADDTTAGTVRCAAGATVCRAPIPGSGTMWAYTATTGGDSTSARVTVRDRFELRAAPAMIGSGSVVTFRPFLNGQSTTAAAWKWIPDGTAAWDSIAGCTAGASECHRVTYESGTMWAYRSTFGSGDSASATVTVSIDCGAGMGLNRRAGRPGARRNTAGIGGCAQGQPGTAGDSATDTLPKVQLTMVLETDGLAPTPDSGVTQWPTGTVVPYNLAAKQGYKNAIGFLDDTLLASSTGTITMSRNRVVKADADSAYELRSGISDLRHRLRTIVGAADKPAAYASYLLWALDTALTQYGDQQTLDDNVGLAEYLEFDPTTAIDGDALSNFDDAMAFNAFEVESSPSGHTIHIVRPDDGTISANRAPRRNRILRSDLGSMDTATTFIFVNGIRTLEGGAFQTSGIIRDLVNAAGTMPHAHATYYWNRNLRGEILNFADPTFGCAGAAAREFPYRSTWTAIARYTQLCKPLSIVTHVIPDDLFGSVSQFLKLRYNWPTPGGADADRLARMIADYHRSLTNTVIVPHSQGNMVTALALPLVAQYDTSGATGCVAELSLAAPIKIVDMNMPDSTLLRGMTIDGDILLRIGLPNDFTPYLTNANSSAMHLDTDWAVDPAIRTLALLKWGVKIHLVDENYLSGQLSSVTTGNLRQLYDRCMPQ